MTKDEIEDALKEVDEKIARLEHDVDYLEWHLPFSRRHVIADRREELEALADDRDGLIKQLEEIDNAD